MESGDLEGPRSSINRQHLLGDLIVIRVCGVLAGANGPNAIGVWAIGVWAIGVWAIGVWAWAHAEWLVGYVKLPHGIPSHDTIGRLLESLQPPPFKPESNGLRVCVRDSMVVSRMR